MRWLFVLSLLSSFACPVRAQEYVWRHYGAEAGLPTAHTLTFDGAGTLLVGTNDGLARFDGRAFVDVPLPVKGSVWRLVKAADGVVWGLTNRAGLFRLAPGTSAEAVPVPAALLTRLHEKVWPIRLRTDARSRLWLSGGDGVLYRWNGPIQPTWAAIRVPETDFVGDFFLSDDGDDGEIVVATRERVGVLPLRTGQPGTPRWLSPFDQRVYYVRPHPTALAWVGGDGGFFLLAHDGGVRRMNTTSERAWPHHEPDVDTSGRLLTLGEAKGTRILRFSPGGALELAAGAEEGLKDGLPVRFAFGLEGGFWFAHHRGVTALNDERTRIYPLQGGRQEFITGIVGDPVQGTLWVSTFGGMYRLNGPHLISVTGPEPRVVVSPVLEVDGSVSWTEVWPEGSRGQSSRGTAPGRNQILVYDGPAGRYETNEDGFWRVHEGRRRRLGPDFLPSRGSADPTGRLWLASEGGHLDVVWQDTLGSACPGCLPPTLRTALDSLNARRVVAGTTADPYGRIWVTVATGGLGVLWPEAGGRWAWHLYGEEEGLLSQSVSTVTVSPDGQRLWLGTYRGIQGLRLAPGPPRIIPFVELRARDGLEGEIVSAVMEDKQGYLWAALVQGRIHRLDWQALVARRSSPPVRIERVELNGQAIAAWEQGLRLRDGDRLGMAVVPQTYRQPLRVRLEYRLAGRDTTWIDLGTGRQLALAALPEGQYALEARAVREGQPPGPPIMLSLIVVPPFWRTPWFATLMALILGLLAFTIHRVREGRRRAAEALRLRIATDLHDEIGSGLTQVTLYSELIRRTAEGTADTDQREDADARVSAWAARVGQQASALSGAMRDVVWAIRPEEDAWEALELRMKDAAVALLAPHDIEVDMAGEVEGSPPMMLTPEMRQNVLLFFKEAIHNAARHAAPSRVEVRWHLTRHALSLCIADDGRGFDPATARQGLGLTSLHRRAEVLGGTFVLTTAPGEGTRLQLDVPLGRAWPWQQKGPPRQRKGPPRQRDLSE